MQSLRSWRKTNCLSHGTLVPKFNSDLAVDADLAQGASRSIKVSQLLWNLMLLMADQSYFLSLYVVCHLQPLNYLPTILNILSYAHLMLLMERFQTFNKTQQNTYFYSNKQLPWFALRGKNQPFLLHKNLILLLIKYQYKYWSPVNH